MSEPIFDPSLFVTLRKRLDQEFFSLLEVMLYEKDVRSMQVAEFCIKRRDVRKVI